ncbi:MAG TPA: hypothetical protein VF010_16960 [Methylomirabilota bacterium]|nr:hypothetical protein [Methylomirabilota bacterium]
MPTLMACFECGASCCARCAIHLESAAYCSACAGLLLEAPAVRAAAPFDLH